MAVVSGEDVRRALIDRVSRKVSGHGIARRVVAGAVDRVLAALPAHIAPPDTLAAAELGGSLTVLDPPDAARVRA